MAPPKRVPGGALSTFEWFWIVIVAALILAILAKKSPLKRVIVYEHQKALRYRKGHYAGTLGPGQYWIISSSSSIVPVDVRTEFVTIQGQDVLSADGVTLKVSLAAEFEVADPNVAINKNVNFQAEGQGAGRKDSPLPPLPALT